MATPVFYTQIRDPLHGRLDLTAVHDILITSAVQRMQRITQLGGVGFVFPSATSTRLMHMMGVYHITSIRVKENLERRLITAEEGMNARIAGLVHDVGHGVFSHLIEPIQGNHDLVGQELVLGSLAEPISNQGGDPIEVARIMRRESPLSSLIFGAPLAADTLDYLARDAQDALGDFLKLDDFYTTHVRWDHEHGLLLLPRGLMSVVSVIQRYWYQYSEVYERISVRLVQRYIQELLRQMISLDPMVSRHLHLSGEAGTMGAIQVWCEDNPTSECAARHQLLLQRRYPKKALVYSPWPSCVPVRDKGVTAKVECDMGLIATSERWAPTEIAEKEKAIASLLDFPAYEVSISPSPPSRRWSVPRVKVKNKCGVDFLSDLLPELEASAQVYGKMSQNVVVSVVEEKRTAVLVSDAHLHNQILSILKS